MDNKYALHLISILRHEAKTDLSPSPALLLKLFGDIMSKANTMGDRKSLEFMYCMLLLLQSFMEDGE